MLSFSERLNPAAEHVHCHEADPLRDKVERVVRGMDAISTAALLDLVGLRNTTGNARRISKTMQSLGYVAIKSRRFMPGGWKDTVTRGWSRPVRESKPC
jgi:hypothetical protein